MKQLLCIVLILFSTISYGQKFDQVMTTSIDSVNSFTDEYTVDIEFKLDEDDKSLTIYEMGSKPVTVRFDVLHDKRNGTYLLTIGKPDYFIISVNYVLHHREYNTKLGIVIIRSRYSNSLTKI